MNILVTGMSGLIGGLVRARLGAHANSRNRWGYRDLTHAEEAVGFVPHDGAEDHRQ